MCIIICVSRGLCITVVLHIGISLLYVNGGINIKYIVGIFHIRAKRRTCQRLRLSFCRIAKPLIGVEGISAIYLVCLLILVRENVLCAFCGNVITQTHLINYAGGNDFVKVNLVVSVFVRIVNQYALHCQKACRCGNHYGLRIRRVQFAHHCYREIQICLIIGGGSICAAVEEIGTSYIISTFGNRGSHALAVVFAICCHLFCSLNVLNAVVSRPPQSCALPSTVVCPHQQMLLSKSALLL